MTVMMAGRDIQGAEVAPLILLGMVVMGARMEVMEITALLVTLAGEDRARIYLLLSTSSSSASLLGVEDRKSVYMVAGEGASW